ncbi:MAG: iron-containing alcohol dehydrogenase [Oscillospiraceae bacterium]|jgi:glycerol-1-phosphate dehydrogenase [NAD(P)+]|nr:iron-containing alcohol dehydrogenase [Oscillospiraceae bacterium]
MDYEAMARELESCPCAAGTQRLPYIRIGESVLPTAGEILRQEGFPRKILLISDENTTRAARGLLRSLVENGFVVRRHIYPDLRSATLETVKHVRSLTPGIAGIIAVGTGCISDVCRMAASQTRKPLCIFATAASMDGFASATAPIITDGFKTSHQAKAPDFLLADTAVLEKAPAFLTAAGVGDIAGKCIALADWRIAALFGECPAPVAAVSYKDNTSSQVFCTEPYCPQIAAHVREAFHMVSRKTDSAQPYSTQVLEALILSGLCMAWHGSSRPASGAEHSLAHFWEMRKLFAEEAPEFHGAMVGVATLLLAEVYHRTVNNPSPAFVPEHKDKVGLRRAFPGLEAEIKRMNCPSPLANLSPEQLAETWPDICRIVREEIPPTAELEALLRAAGAPLTPEEIHVPAELVTEGLRYSSYARKRITLLRILNGMGPGIV